MHLEDLQTELARQNAALEEAKTALAQLGDVQLHVPEELLTQLDDACTPQTSATTYNAGLRA